MRSNFPENVKAYIFQSQFLVFQESREKILSFKESLAHGPWLHGILFLVQKTSSYLQKMIRLLRCGAVDEA